MNQQIVWPEHLPTEYAPERTSFDVGGFLRRCKWFVLFGVMTAMGAGYFYGLRQPPVFESSVQVLIDKKGATSPLSGGGSEALYAELSPAQNVGTQIALMTSPLIVDRAIREHELASLPSLQGVSNPTQAIIASLSGAATPGALNVVTLSCRNREADDCRRILDAVVRSYQDFLGESQQNVSQETVELIEEANEKLRKELEKKEQDYQAFRHESPLLWTGAEGTNIHETRLTPIEASRAELLLARSQTEAQLEALQAALSQDVNREALILMLTRSLDQTLQSKSAAETNDESTTVSELFPLMLEEQILLQTVGPDHPKARLIRRKLEVTQKFLREHTGQKAAPVEEKDFLKIYVDSLRQELLASTKKEEKLNALFDHERQAAKELSDFHIRDQLLRNDIARTQQLFDSVVKRLQEINLIKDYGGYVTQIISPATLGRQVAPQMSIILTIAGILGTLLGLGLAYLVELSDTRFRSPEDIRDRLGLPVIGHIPVIHERRKERRRRKSSPAPAVAPMIRAFHKPGSQVAEAYRAVRTSLYFNLNGDRHKIIQVTSPDPGDGKSTLASNLAVSVAQSGKRVLLIDADCRRPRLHTLFGIDRAQGLVAVLKDQLEIADAIHPTEIDNLWVMPCGERPSNPAELVSSPRFHQLLALLRDKWDFLIVDTPPLLAVTDPAAIAARVDGVLLTIRLNRNSSASAVRAGEILATMGARVLGVVVNGVGGGRRGYGAGAYRYYGARNGYAYYGAASYGGGKSEHRKYYSDEDAEPESASAARGNGHTH